MTPTIADVRELRRGQVLELDDRPHGEVVYLMPDRDLGVSTPDERGVTAGTGERGFRWVLEEGQPDDRRPIARSKVRPDLDDARVALERFLLETGRIEPPPPPATFGKPRHART